MNTIVADLDHFDTDPDPTCEKNRIRIPDPVDYRILFADMLSLLFVLSNNLCSK
jgi:hypothetical protein